MNSVLVQFAGIRPRGLLEWALLPVHVEFP